MRPLLRAACGYTLLLSAMLLAQERPAVIRSDSRLVVVDSIVADKKGVYVTDLTQKDFIVFEDGKEQTITTFSFQPDQQRNLVLLFDDSTVASTERQSMRDAAVKFIESNAGSNQLTAIAEFSGTLRVVQNFTADVESLKHAVTGMRINAGADTSGVSESHAAAGLANYSARTLLGALRDMAARLANAPGRKTMVLFSGGFVARSEELNAVVKVCNRANVAIYPVEIRPLASSRQGDDLDGGLNAGDATARHGQSLPSLARNSASTRQTGEVDLQGPLDALAALAKGSGGFAIPRNGNLLAGLERVSKEQSEYYMLGYVPAQEARPGACHVIKVKVNRPGAGLRSRNGYCEGKNSDVLAGTATQRELEARISANATPTVPATIQAAFFYTSPNIARIEVAIDIPGAGMNFTKDKGKFRAKLNVTGIASLPDGVVGARFSDSVDLTLDDKKQVDEFRSQQYHYETQFEMPSGDFDLKVAFSGGPDSFGRVETPLKVDDWEPTKFLLSGLAFSKSTRPASDAVLDSTAELFGDKVPLVSNGVQFIPSGTDHFHWQEKAFIYAEIYEPALAAPNGKEYPALAVQMIVLDGKTGILAKDFGVTRLKVQMQPGNPAVPIGLLLSLVDLTPGSYVVQLTALDSAGNRSTRRIGFELEP